MSDEPSPDTPLFAPDLLDGRSALVTGGGTGIGYGIAGRLASCGARVAIASRTLERLERAAADLEEAHGRRVIPLRTNVREPDTIRDTVDRTARELGGLDILVNNAAGNFYCRSEELTPGGWRAVVETDLYGSFYASQAAFPHMREAGWGRIVSISMTLHHRGWPRMAHATAAKAGVDALTRTLALEWGPHGIRVNAVAPGPIPTEAVKEAFSAAGGRGSGGGNEGDGPAGEEDAPSRDDDAPARAPASPPDIFSTPRATEKYARMAIPAGRMGRPEDIGNMVTYLCSPAGDWITGAILVVDGGESLSKLGGLPQPPTGSETRGGGQATG